MELPDFHIPHAEKIEWMIETTGWGEASEPQSSKAVTASVAEEGYCTAELKQIALIATGPVQEQHGRGAGLGAGFETVDIGQGGHFR